MKSPSFIRKLMTSLLGFIVLGSSLLGNVSVFAETTEDGVADDSSCVWYDYYGDCIPYDSTSVSSDSLDYDCIWYEGEADMECWDVSDDWSDDDDDGWEDCEEGVDENCDWGDDDDDLSGDDGYWTDDDDDWGGEYYLIC